MKNSVSASADPTEQSSLFRILQRHQRRPVDDFVAQREHKFAERVTGRKWGLDYPCHFEFGLQILILTASEWSTAPRLQHRVR